MSRHRARQVRRDAFGVVPEAVAVGIGLACAHRPRIAERIKGRGGLERRRIGDAARHAHERDDAVEVGMGPLVPERVVEGGRTPGKGNYVLGPCSGRAKERVEAVEHLVVVVHAVAVSVGETRIGRDVDARRRHHDARLYHLTGDHAVPVVDGRRHVAVLAPAGSDPGRRVHVVVAVAVVLSRDDCIAGHYVRDHFVDEIGHFGTRELVDGDRAVNGVGDDRDHSAVAPVPDCREDELVCILHHRREGRCLVDDVVAEKRPHGIHQIVLALVEIAAHERGRDVVVAEVAHLLDEILLVVLEPVVVEVHVAARAEQRVGRVAVVYRVGPSVASPRRVHAAADVDDVARERDV